MRIRPFLRLGGWVLVVIGPMVGLVAFLFAGRNPDPLEAAIGWVVAFAGFLTSGSLYWLLRRTGGDTDDPAARYQPSSVLGEMAVPVVRRINEVSRPFTRGGIGIITLGAWVVAIMILATVWFGVLLLTGMIMVLVARGFEALGINFPEQIGWLAALVGLVVPIAVVVLVYQWAMRRPSVRYWLR